MAEKMPFESAPRQEERESIESRKERLQPVFMRSLEVFRNPDRPLVEGVLTVTRDNDGQTETFGGLVILDVLEDAVEMGIIEDDGEIGSSAYMSWDEIIDAKEGQS